MTPQPCIYLGANLFEPLLGPGLKASDDHRLRV